MRFVVEGLLAVAARYPRLLVALAALPGVMLLMLLIHKQPGSGELYYEYANLVLGEPAKREWIIWNPHRQGPMPTDVAIPHGPQVPYLDFPCEYPPLALAVMVIPRLFSSDLATYDTAYRSFAALAMLALLGLLLSFAGGANQGRQQRVLTALGWSAIIFANGSLVTTRFDVFAVLFAFAGMRLLVAKHPGFAGIALGLGGAIKLWPLTGVLLAVRFLHARSQGVRLVAGIAAAFVLPHALLALGWNAPTFSYLSYHVSRGIHVESVLGNLILVWSSMSGGSITTVMNYGACHLGLSLETAALAVRIWTVLLFPVLGYVLWLARRAQRTDIGLLLFSTIVAWLLLSAKVFSGEYLIWLSLLLLLPSGPHWLTRVGLVVLAGLLTKRYYSMYLSAIAGALFPNLLLTFRNGIILVELVLCIIALRRLTAPEAASASPG